MISSLCPLLGYSRQAYHKWERSQCRDEGLERDVLAVVADLRRSMPRLGTGKLWYLLNANGLRIGRDRLYGLLRRQGLLVKAFKRRAVTTDSRGWRHQYPNLVKGISVESPNQVWVSDITYLPTASGFVYLSLVTDVYSRRIMGWSVSPTLASSGPLEALRLAFENCSPAPAEGLIHHSDRGGQYCSAEYVRLLSAHNARVSMTQDGSPYDNGIAERVNGILKREWLDMCAFEGLEDARRAVGEAVRHYNCERPHYALRMEVPELAYHNKDKRFVHVMY